MFRNVKDVKNGYQRVLGIGRIYLVFGRLYDFQLREMKIFFFWFNVSLQFMRSNSGVCSILGVIVCSNTGQGGIFFFFYDKGKKGGGYKLLGKKGGRYGFVFVSYFIL